MTENGKKINRNSGFTLSQAWYPVNQSEKKRTSRVRT